MYIPLNWNAINAEVDVSGSMKPATVNDDLIKKKKIVVFKMLRMHALIISQSWCTY
jgi:hypothetical protein